MLFLRENLNKQPTLLVNTNNKICTKQINMDSYNYETFK